jgi:PAS domain S-box-containing protein
VTRWVTFAAYAALGLGALISAFSLYLLLSSVRQEAQREQASGQNFLIWYSVQHRHELMQLLETLRRRIAGDATAPMSEVITRFDVLWSRLDNSGRGRLGARFMTLVDARETVRLAREVLRRHEPLMVTGAAATPAARAATGPPALESLVVDLQALVPRFQGIALEALEKNQALQAARGERRRGRATQTLYLLAGLIVSGVGVALLLLFERVRTENLRRVLERRFRDSTALLRDSERRHRLLNEHAPEALVVLDPAQGRFVDTNDNAVALFGRSREELLSLAPADISPPVSRTGRRRARRRGRGCNVLWRARRWSSNGCTAVPVERRSRARSGWCRCPSEMPRTCAAASSTSRNAAAPRRSCSAIVTGSSSACRNARRS